VIAVVALPLFAFAILGFNLDFFRSRKRTAPVGTMTDEEVRLQPAVRHWAFSHKVGPHPGWKVYEVSCWAEVREAIAVLEIEIRTGGGRVIARESAVTFAARKEGAGFRRAADGDRTLISFPVVEPQEKIVIGATLEMEGPADDDVFCRIRYMKLGTGPGLLWADAWTGPYIPGRVTTGARDRIPETGLYPHAMDAAAFRARAAEFPFETTWSASLKSAPPPDLFASREKVGVLDGPHVWLRHEDAWLLEAPDGRTHLVSAERADILPGRLVTLVRRLRERETASHPFPRDASVQVAGTKVAVTNLLEVVKRFDAKGLVIDGLTVRER